MLIKLIFLFALFLLVNSQKCCFPNMITNECVCPPGSIFSNLIMNTLLCNNENCDPSYTNLIRKTIITDCYKGDSYQFFFITTEYITKDSAMVINQDLKC